MREFMDKLLAKLEERKKAWTVKGIVFSHAGGTTIVDEMAFGICNGLYEAIEIVNQLAEEHKGGWIPCSERLPIGKDYTKRIDGVNYYKHMLTATNDIAAPICIGWYDQEDETWYDLEGFSYHPIAWQPLPAPYE